MPLDHLFDRSEAPEGKRVIYYYDKPVILPVCYIISCSWKTTRIVGLAGGFFVTAGAWTPHMLLRDAHTVALGGQWV